MKQEKKTLLIDTQKCNKCGRCLSICKKWGQNGDCEHCIANGMPLCANECPKGAIFFADKDIDNYKSISTIQNFSSNHPGIIPYFLFFGIVGIFFPIVAFFYVGEYLWQPGNVYDIHDGIACIECHTPFEGVASEKCAICHEEACYDFQSHPLPMTAITCELCHQEHSLNKEGITTMQYMHNDNWCLTCHEENHKNVPDLIEEPTEYTKSFVLQNFDHQYHFYKRSDLTCQHCHSEIASNEDRLMPIVKYESCLECHEEYTVSNHGNWDLCHECHADDLDTKAPSQKLQRNANTEIEIVEVLWKGTREKTNKIDGKLTFNHERHLERTDPPEDCLFCHEQGVQELPAMQLDSTELCQKCHNEETHIELITQESIKDRLKFDHVIHLTKMEERYDRVLLYQKSCLACHELDENGNFKKLPDEKTCRLCHVGHQNFGDKYETLISCTYCHYDTTKESWSEKNQKIYRKYGGFSHDHHGQQHKYLSCEDCHDKQKESTQRSKNVMLNLKQCEQCHNNTEEKGKDCFKCHGYHRMFIIK